MPGQPRSGKSSTKTLAEQYQDKPFEETAEAVGNRIRSMQQQLDMRPPAAQVASPQEQFNRDVVASLKDLLAMVNSLRD